MTNPAPRSTKDDKELKKTLYELGYEYGQLKEMVKKAENEYKRGKIDGESSIP